MSTHSIGFNEEFKELSFSIKKDEIYTLTVFVSAAGQIKMCI